MSKINTLIINKAAKSSFTIEETVEAGIKLTGPEVKSAKKGQINLKGAYVSISDEGRASLVGCHISAYKPAGVKIDNYNPKRQRLLLIHKKEQRSLYGKIKQKGYSIIPLEIYDKAGIIKVLIGLGRGKKKFEKRELIKKREAQREIMRRLKTR